MAIWDAYAYGWNVNYFATIAGIDAVWTEAYPQGPTIPPAYSQWEPSLVVDNSAEIGSSVDRSTGMGQGLPFTFSLLSNPIARGFMRQDQNRTNLDVTLTADETTTMTVQSTAGLINANSYVHVGLECIGYSGSTGTTLTGLTRGLFGTLPATHYAGTVAGQVCDRPDVWRGREVRLYAVPMGPDGVCTGAVLGPVGAAGCEAVEVWRGSIDQGPYRDGNDRFTFECLALDRILTNPLPAGVTGTILPPYLGGPVYPDQWLSITLDAQNSGWTSIGGIYPFGFTVWPFAAFTGYTAIAPGTLMTVPDQAARVQAAVTAKLASLSGSYPTLLGVTFHPGYGSSNGVDYTRMSTIELKWGDAPDSTIKGMRTWVDTSWNKGNPWSTNFGFGNGGIGSVKNPEPMQISGYWTNGSVLVASNESNGSTALSGDGGYLVQLQLDNATAAVPTTGTLIIDTMAIQYGHALLQGNVVTLSTLWDLSQPYSANTGWGWNPPADVTGKKASLQFAQQDLAVNCVLKLLQSSGGTSGDVVGGVVVHGTNDAWPVGQGYGLPDQHVDAQNIQDMLMAKIGTMNLLVGGSGVSFQDQIGGLLLLSQTAIVARPDKTGTVRLGIVDTSLSGSYAEVTIYDKHLLCAAGEPITAIRKRDRVTQVVASLAAYSKSTNPLLAPVKEFGDYGTANYTIQMPGGQLEVGGVQLSANLSLSDPKSTDIAKIEGWGSAIIQQSQYVMSMEFRVVPWLPVQTGDLVGIDVTHPALWDWRRGVEGFSGYARCLGARRDLAGGALILELLIQGGPETLSLCPAATVTAFSGGSTTPIVIYCDGRFYNFFYQMLQANNGAACRLYHYWPGKGTENSGGYVEINDVQLVSGVCHLTVSSYANLTESLTVGLSRLTLPPTPYCTDWQSLFSHAEDGSHWGA